MLLSGGDDMLQTENQLPPGSSFECLMTKENESGRNCRPSLLSDKRLSSERLPLQSGETLLLPSSSSQIRCFHMEVELRMVSLVSLVYTSQSDWSVGTRWWQHHAMKGLDKWQKQSFNSFGFFIRV